MDFDLTDLQLFVRVVDAGSITAGAHRAHLALASASARIADMEHRCGSALLVRGRRGIRVTPAGEALADHARRVLEQMERLRGDLGEFAHGLKGRVRLWANTAAVMEFLPSALSTFLAQHPHVDVDLVEGLSFEIVRAITKAQAEVGIVSDVVDFSGLETFPFRRDRLVLVCARDDALKRKKRVHFADLLEREFVGLSEGGSLQDYLADHAAKAGKRMKLRVRLRSFDAICRLVECGVGIGIVSETAARRCQKAMAIRSIPLDDAWAHRHLTLCVRSYAQLSRPARQLVDALRPAER
jgi:DNA-binding transcriptional LysR family regulator